MTAPTPRIRRQRLGKAKVVDVLTDDDRHEVWIDRQGVIWACNGDDWMWWDPGQWEATYAGEPSEHGPFTEIRRVDQ